MLFQNGKCSLKLRLGLRMAVYMLLGMQTSHSVRSGRLLQPMLLRT